MGSRGAGAFSSGGGSDEEKKARQLKNAIEKTFRKYEESIRDLDHEKAVIIDPKDGHIVGTFDGKEDEVSLPRGFVVGNALTHNHPDNIFEGGVRIDGGPFSSEDLKTLQNAEMYQMRATTSKRTHILTRIENYDHNKAKSFNIAYKRFSNKAWKEAQKEGGNRVIQDFKSGKIKQINNSLVGYTHAYSNEAWHKMCSEWLKTNSERFGFKYSVIERRRTHGKES